jgi:hypothetical protein
LNEEKELRNWRNYFLKIIKLNRIKLSQFNCIKINFKLNCMVFHSIMSNVLIILYK